jgi:hypothetical protein
MNINETLKMLEDNLKKLLESIDPEVLKNYVICIKAGKVTVEKLDREEYSVYLPEGIKK